MKTYTINYTDHEGMAHRQTFASLTDLYYEIKELEQSGSIVYTIDVRE